MEDQPTQRRLVAVLIADIAGYTRLMEQDTDGTVAAWQTARREVIKPVIADHSGKIVKLTGDGFLVEFSTVQNAVNCAIVMQRGLASSSLDFRMGINLGDIVDDGEDIHGEGVNIAARLEGLADPGGICISGDVYNQVRNRIEATFENLGDQKVKNVATPVRVYAIRTDGSAAPSASVAPAPADKPSIAVLPFNNLSGDPEQEYFADGITEDIITALSKLRWFLVIARNSTFVYKGKAVDIKQVARELSVDYVVEGSIQKSGNRIRISAQLIDGTTGNHLWAEKYDRELADIFDVQDEITQTVVATIEPKLVAAEGVRSQRRSSEDLNAWQLVMRAMNHFGKMTSKESQTAIALLQEAVQKYPDYGPAHSLLAFALLVSGHVGWIPESEVYSYSTKLVHRAGELARRAGELARRAAELDDEDPWAHLALGNYCFIERRTEEAVREYLKAIDLNPNFAIAYGSLGRALVFDGQSEDAVNYFQKAFRMSPHDPLIAVFYSGMGTAHYYAHRYDEAIEWSRKAIRERPGYTAAHRILCASLAMAGRTEDTEAAAATLRQLQPNISIAWVEQHVPYTPRAMPHFLDGMRKAGVPES
jgi:TolB-like protein/cytochrome c-type biogenesis protein CcmH/NrfG